MGLPAVTGNWLLDPAFYVSSALIVLTVAGFVAWLVADKWRFRHEDGSEMVAAVRMAAAADLSSPAPAVAELSAPNRAPKRKETAK